MDRYQIPLRFTLLWAVCLAVIMTLEMVYGVSAYLPFAQKDITAVYCTAAGALAALGVTVWGRFSKKD